MKVLTDKLVLVGPSHCGSVHSPIIDFGALNEHYVVHGIMFARLSACNFDKVFASFWHLTHTHTQMHVN